MFLNFFAYDQAIVRVPQFEKHWCGVLFTYGTYIKLNPERLLKGNDRWGTDYPEQFIAVSLGMIVCCQGLRCSGWANKPLSNVNQADIEGRSPVRSTEARQRCVTVSYCGLLKRSCSVSKPRFLKGRIKLSLCLIKWYGAMEVEFHAFLNSAPGGGERLAARPQLLYLRGKAADVHWMGGGSSVGKCSTILWSFSP